MELVNPLALYSCRGLLPPVASLTLDLGLTLQTSCSPGLCARRLSTHALTTYIYTHYCSSSMHSVLFRFPLFIVFSLKCHCCEHLVCAPGTHMPVKLDLLQLL